jgi:SAM-dependent methyltransferase
VGQDGTVPYDPTIYAGSARHYRPGRPPYSAELPATLTRELGLDGQGRLLDVGCGPGILTLGLADLFDEADPEMLAVGAEVAAEQQVANVRWVQDVAENLDVVDGHPFRLVTFGQSFHWTQRDPVAELRDLLAARAHDGRFSDWPGDTEIVIGTKAPAA